jgi:hypothetical protein
MKKLARVFPFVEIKKALLSLPLLISFVLVCTNLLGQSIGTVTVTGTPVCAGSNVSLSFLVTNGTGGSNRFTTSTNYIVYLSSSAGSFAAPTTITTFTSSTAPANTNGASATITQSVTIPSGTGGGSGFRISVGSTSPGFTGSGGANQSSAFTINARPTVTFTTQPGASACVGVDVTYTTQSGQSNYLWTVPGVLNTDYSITSGGISTGSNTVTLKWLTTGSKTVTINYTNSNGCTAASATSSTATTVNALPTVTFTAQPGATACTGFDVTYTTQSGQSNYLWTVPGVLNTDYSITSGGIGTGSNTVTLKWLTTGSKTVTINYTNSNGCTAVSATSSTATTVSASPTVTFSAQPGASTCVGTDVTYTTQSSQSNYLWTVPGVLNTDYSITSGGIGTGSNTVTLKWLTTGSKTVTINYTNASGCAAPTATSSTATTVNSLPTPSFTVQPGANACIGIDVTYTTQSSQSNYLWTVPGVLNTDYSITSGGIGTGSNTVTLKWLTTGSKTVTINYTNSNGCTAASATSSTATTVNALPTVTFTAQPGATACAGFDVTYTTQSSQSNYVWSVPGVLNTDYSITSGGIGTGSNTVTLKWLTTGSKTVTINYTNSDGCTAASATSSTATTVDAEPTVTFTTQPGASACINTDVIYTTQVGQTSYVWTFPGVLNTDYSITSGGTSADNTVTLKWLTAGSKTVTVNYTNASGCTAASATSSTATMVDDSASPSFTAQPVASICIGVDVTYTTEAGQSNYVWTVPGILNTNYSITAGGTSSSSNTVTLNWLTTGNKTVTVNYSNGCGAGATAASSSTTVNALPNVTFIAQPGAAACSGHDVTYTTQNGQTNYIWTVPGTLGTDYSITSGGIGTGNRIVTLKWLTTGSKTVTINYTNSNGCTAASATSSTATTVIAAPTVTFTVQPGTDACIDQDVTYTTQAGQSNYIWTVPGTLGTNYTITSGGIGTSSNTVTLKWITTGNKTVTINYTNAAGCAAGTATSSTTTSVHALPTPTFSVEPGATACIGVNVTYTTQNGQTNYLWTVPGTLGTDYSITSGSIGTGSRTVTLRWLTTGSKTVTINYTNANGCTAASATSSTATTVNALPTPSFTAQPSGSYCVGVDVTYTTEAGQSNYIWTVPGTQGTNYSITSGGIGTGSNTVTLKWLTGGSKTVTINYSNANGCVAASATSSNTITVNTLPTITHSASATGVCYSAGAQTTPLTYSATTGTPNQYSINWNASPANGFATVTNAALPASPITISVPAGTSGGTYTGNLTVRNSTTGCVSVSSSFTVTVNNDVTDLTASATAGQCSNTGIVVTLSSSVLSSGTYSVDYKFNNSGSTFTATNVVFTAGSPGSANFTTVAPSASDNTVTIKGISRTSPTCNSGTLTINSNTFTVSAPPDAASNSLTTSASGTNIGNLLGSTVTIVSTKLTAGTYTIGYTVTDAATNTTIYINSTQSITFVNSAKRNRLQGSFSTGQLSSLGSYRVNINSITSSSTGCTTIISGEFATFSVVNSIFTVANGLWDGTGVWNSNGAGPDYTSGEITINHQVTYDATAISTLLELDQLTIGSTGELIIASGQEFKLKDGGGTFDITIQAGGKLTIGSTSLAVGDTYNGTLVVENGATHNGTSTSTVTFRTQSLYQHLFTTSEGAPPLATWAPSSTMEVKGYTSAALTFASSGWSQNFGLFVWNCASQSANINLNGLLGLSPSTSGSIQGSITIQNTGTGIVRFGDDDDYSLTVPTLSVTGTARFSTGPSNGNGPEITLNLGNFIYGSAETSWLCEAGVADVNVTGNIQINSGTVYLSDGGNNINRSGATVNLAGDLTIATGAVLDASSSNSNRTGLLIYNNLPASNAAKTHLHTINGSIVGFMQYQIAANQTVRAVNESPFSSLRTNAGTFSVNSTAILIVESEDLGGAIQAGTTNGNLRVPNTGRLFNSGAVIEYGRTSSANQYIGEGHPSTSGVICRINNGSSGVAVSSTGSTVTVGGDLQIISGNLTVKENNLTVLQDTETISGNIIVTPRTVDTTTTFRTDGAINMTGGNIQMNSSASINAANTSLLINGDLQGTNYFVFSGNNCRVTIEGTAPATFSRPFPINAPTLLEQLTINRPGATLVVDQNLTLGNYPANSVSGLTLQNGNLDMNANLLVNADATLEIGTLFFEDRQIELQRNIQPSATGLFSANSGSTLSITSSFNGTTADSLLFTPTGNTLGTLILNRSTSVLTRPNIFINTPVTIANFLYLTDGTFFNESGLTMEEDATIVRTPEASFYTGSVVPAGGPYNIIYNNYLTTSIQTGLESQGYINNLTSNANNVSVENNVDIHGTLDVNLGSVFDADGATETAVLTLRSTNDNPDRTANVAPLDGSINGNITVQRYMSPELRMYRYLSSPVSDAFVDDWMDDFPITGNFLDRSNQAQWGHDICGLELQPFSTSMYYYDEAVSGIADKGYKAYPVAQTNSYDNPLIVGLGYSAFIRECLTATVIDVRGEINRGEINLQPKFTFHSGTTAGSGDGWNLIGNPYPSAIDWSHPSWTKINIVNAISIMDNDTGIMHYYDGPGGLVDDFSGVIASGQAFWVRAMASPSLIIREAAKVNGNGNDHEFYRIASEKSAPAISIALSVNGITDKTHLKVQAGSHIEMDNWDMPKLKNESFGISSFTPGGISMAISAVPEIKEGLRIPLKLEGLTDGVYSLKFSSTEEFNLYSIELTDRELGIKKIMNWNDTYEVVIVPNRENENRFSAKLVRYQPSSEVEVTNLIAYPNPIKDVLTVRLPPDGLTKSIRIYDQKGLMVEERIETPESLISEISFSSWPSGVYLVRLVGPGYNFLTKVIKE